MSLLRVQGQVPFHPGQSYGHRSDVTSTVGAPPARLMNDTALQPSKSATPSQRTFSKMQNPRNENKGKWPESFRVMSMH